jgi:predicted flap endonuclease-1-like 5' DNA nuclease
MEEIMFRWFVRFSVAASLGALLVWLWNRYNEDLLEEDLDEEIPLEFDVADDAPTLVAGTTFNNRDGGNGTPAAATASASGSVAAETEERPAPAPTAVVDSASADATDRNAASAAPAALETAEKPTESATEPEPVLDSPAPTPAGAGDNVIIIKGIGPKYSEKLAEMGITTFGALLGTPMDTLAIAFPRVSEEELQSWLEQARELADHSGETA